MLHCRCICMRCMEPKRNYCTVSTWCTGVKYYINFTADRSMRIKFVFLFPGQNSKYPAMLDRLRAVTPVTHRVLRKASRLLGRDLDSHYRADNPDIFSRNRDVQIGVFLTNFIYARALEDAGCRADASAGLSLGEYNHLVEIGALSFESALRLLDARGAAYDAAPQGCMKSVFPCQEQDVEEALIAGRQHGSVDVSIRLGKSHFVLGGDAPAVEASVVWLENEAYAQSRLVDPRLPMHASLFRPAGNAFKAALESVPWYVAHAPYLPNVDGEILGIPCADEIVDRLYRHVFSTVQWQRSIECLVRRFSGATFIEVGPKSVLYNLVSREYRSLDMFHVDGDDTAALFPAFRTRVAAA